MQRKFCQVNACDFQRGDLISFLVTKLLNQREFINLILTIQCTDTTSQSDVSKKNRLEQLVPSSKVIVARKHSGLEIAKADPVAGWHTFSENLWRGQCARTDQWNRSNARTLDSGRLDYRFIVVPRQTDFASNPWSFANAIVLLCIVSHLRHCPLRKDSWVNNRGNGSHTTFLSFGRSLFKLEALLFVDFLRLRRTRVSCWTEPRWVSPTSTLKGRKMYRTVISFLAIRRMNVNMRSPRLFSILNENIVIPLRTACAVAES